MNINIPKIELEKLLYTISGDLSYNNVSEAKRQIKKLLNIPQDENSYDIPDLTTRHHNFTSWTCSSGENLTSFTPESSTTSESSNNNDTVHFSESYNTNDTFKEFSD